MSQKIKTIYLCSKCGAKHLTWQGKCTVCGEWNSLVAEIQREIKSNASFSAVPLTVESLSNAQDADFARLTTGINEFDRVLGGGIVGGSLILLGGEPGIGKSTLILEVVSLLALKNSVLYVSGEETAAQIKLRADRMGLNLDKVDFIGARDLDAVLATIEKLNPNLVIIDSIQTIYSQDLPGEAGGVGQVRLSTQRLMDLAKSKQIAMVLIGHVTKEGNVAGPKTLEHLVDVVLYLEGERYHTFRLLRGIKNRFGATDETGVFEMTSEGLKPVSNPSAIFLEERNESLPGSCITAALEGIRSFLVEIQALCSTTVFGYPKRTASGVDLNRLQIIIAVLSKRAKLRLLNQDIYVNIAGGFRVLEPAVDLAIALAIFSALVDKPLPTDLVAFGEIGLSGELRRVNNLEKRIKEALNLGFKKILIPHSSEVKNFAGVELMRARTVGEAIKFF